MSYEQFMDYLIANNACREAQEWVSGRDLAAVWSECERADWLLWLSRKAGVDKRKLALAAAECANTVRHLMKDERSLAALDAAYKYGRGVIGDEELEAARFNDAAAAYAAAYAAAAAFAYADAADAAARKTALKGMADLVRNVITVSDLNL